VNFYTDLCGRSRKKAKLIITCWIFRFEGDNLSI